MQYVEKIMVKKRNKSREDKVAIVKYKTRPCQNYEDKNSYVEANIENMMNYLSYGDDKLVSFKKQILKNEIRYRKMKEKRLGLCHEHK